MGQCCHACVNSASFYSHEGSKVTEFKDTHMDRQTDTHDWKRNTISVKAQNQKHRPKIQNSFTKTWRTRKRWFVLFFENGQTGEHWNVRDGKMTRLHVPFACNVCVCFHVNVCVQFWHYQRYSQRRRMRSAAGIYGKGFFRDRSQAKTIFRNGTRRPLRRTAQVTVIVPAALSTSTMVNV